MTHNTPTTPKTETVFKLSTFILSIGITALTFAVAGLILGYFGGIELHSQARQNVVSDMQVVSKTTER